MLDYPVHPFQYSPKKAIIELGDSINWRIISMVEVIGIRFRYVTSLLYSYTPHPPKRAYTKGGCIAVYLLLLE